MSRIDELIREHCPNGVPHLALDQVVSFRRGTQLKAEDRIDGPYPVVTAGRTNDSTHHECNFGGGSVSVSSHGAYAGHVNYWSESIWLSNNVFLLAPRTRDLDARFLFFALKSRQRRVRDRVRGGGVPYMNARDLAPLRVPVPPLEVQREIVRILDQFTQLEAELEAELEARTRQYEHYRTRAFDFPAGTEVRWSTLGDISTRVSSGATPKAGAPEYYSGGSIPWLRTGEVTFGEIWDTEMKITDRALQETGASWIKEDCVIVAISGATAARSAINKIPLTTNQHCCNLEIDQAQANYRYVFFWVSSKYEELKSLGRGARADLNARIIKDFPIPVPSLDEQRRVVALLDQFDALVNDINIGLPAELAARRKQYEHYRDRLLTFEEGG